MRDIHKSFVYDAVWWQGKGVMANCKETESLDQKNEAGILDRV